MEPLKMTTKAGRKVTLTRQQATYLRQVWGFGRLSSGGDTSTLVIRRLEELGLVRVITRPRAGRADGWTAQLPVAGRELMDRSEAS